MPAGRFIPRNREPSPVIDARPVSLEELQARIYAAGRAAVRKFRDELPANSTSPRVSTEDPYDPDDDFTEEIEETL